MIDQVAPGVGRFTLPLAWPSPDHLHVHLLDTPDGVVIVDTGARGSEDALSTGLAHLNGEPRRVLVTHAHIDHWGLATTIESQVLAHPNCETSFRYAAGEPIHRAEWGDARAVRAAFAGFDELVAGVPEIVPLADGDRVGDWEVLWTPGHDPGHICLWCEGDGVLLCGDLLLPGYTPNIQPDGMGGNALGDFLASLDRVAALPIRLVLPAHGEPYADAAGRAAELRAHHLRRLDQLQAAVAAGTSDLDGLAGEVFGAAAVASPADAMLAAMETYAHLEHLRLQEAVAHVDGEWITV